MRIIAGNLGGRRLKSIDAPGLRPTTDRVRESIFNVLSARIDFEGIRVLDLFAGTGALGIEALSRGAGYCEFVEGNRSTASLIHENVDALGLSAQSTVVVRDALAYLHHSDSRFDLVFADPPYAATIFEQLLHDLFSLERITDEGLLVLEHSSFMRGRTTELAELLIEKSFGDTGVSIYKKL